MLSQLEPDGGWGSWSGVTPPGVQGQRVWPPSRGHGFAPTALCAAIAEASRSIRTGNGSAGCTGGCAAKPAAAAKVQCGAGGMGVAGTSQMVSDAAAGGIGESDHAFMGWVGEDRGVSGNPAPDRGLWD